MDNNAITPTGASYLADALRFNTSLERLDIQHNRIADAGASALAVSLLAHPSITSINFIRNEIMCGTHHARVVISHLLQYQQSLAEFCIYGNFTSVESPEIVDDFANAVLAARVSALRKVDWGTGGDSALREAVAERLRANVARSTRVSPRASVMDIDPTENGVAGAEVRLLDLGYSGYMEISPKEISHNLHGKCETTSLTSVFLDHNTLFQINQPVMACLFNLTNLFLSYNRFETAPAAIKLLTNLVVLDLSHNRLTRFPKEVMYLVDLQDLDLSFNSINSVGRETARNFPRLSSLQRLALHRNFLTQVPSILLSLTRLTYIY